MNIRLVVPTLEALDGIGSEVLALPFFQDDRPLQGVAGLVDWRLAGAVSRTIRRAGVKGEFLEKLLIPTRGKLKVERVVFIGLGESDQMNEARFREACEAIAECTRALLARSIACVLPGRDHPCIAPERAMELCLLALDDPGSYDEVLVIDRSEHHRTMAPLIEHAARRRRAMDL